MVKNCDKTAIYVHINGNVTHRNTKSMPILDPRGSRMMPPPGFQVGLWPSVALTFDLPGIKACLLKIDSTGKLPETAICARMCI